MALERVPESGPAFEKTTMRTLRRLLNIGLVGPASPAPPIKGPPPVSLYLCHPPQVRHLFFSFMASAASSLLVSPRPCPVSPRVPRGQLACSKGSSLLGCYLLYCSLGDPGSLGSVPARSVQPSPTAPLSPGISPGAASCHLPPNEFI